MLPVAVAAFVFRICANIFFSAMLGLVCWAFGKLVFVSFFVITDSTERIVAITTVGIGTGVGASAGSLMLGLGRLALMLRILSIIGAAVVGALVSLAIGGESLHPPGMPGIPELSGIVWGGLIAANLLPMALDVVAALRAWFERRHRQNAHA